MENYAEIKSELKALKEGQNQILNALVGSETFNQKGIVHHVAELQEYKLKDEKFKNRVAGGLAVSTPLLTLMWHYFIDWFKSK